MIVPYFIFNINFLFKDLLILYVLEKKGYLFLVTFFNYPTRIRFVFLVVFICYKLCEVTKLRYLIYKKGVRGRIAERGFTRERLFP